MALYSLLPRFPVNAESPAPTEENAEEPVTVLEDALDALAASVQASRAAGLTDKAAETALVEASMPTLIHAARSLPRVSGSKAEHDYVQVGLEMLVRRLGSYDATRGAFTAWLRINARHDMIEYSEQHRRDVHAARSERRATRSDPGAAAPITMVYLDVEPSEDDSFSADGELKDDAYQDDVGASAGAASFPQAESSLGRHQVQQTVRDIVYALPYEYREALCSAHGIGRPKITIRDIAERSGEPFSRVQRRVKRAEELMRVGLAKAGIGGAEE